MLVDFVLKFQEGVLKAREEAIKKGSVQTDLEPFGVELVEYMDAGKIEEVLASAFKERCSYSFRELVFYPEKQVKKMVTRLISKINK